MFGLVGWGLVPRFVAGRGFMLAETPNAPPGGFVSPWGSEQGGGGGGLWPGSSCPGDAAWGAGGVPLCLAASVIPMRKKCA